MSGKAINTKLRKFNTRTLINGFIKILMIRSLTRSLSNSIYKLRLLWKYRLKLVPFVEYCRAEDDRFANFTQEFNEFEQQSTLIERGLSVLWEDKYPCLDDKTKETGFDRHYIYHPAWAARIITKKNVRTHIDISSTLTFSTILSAFIPVAFYDYRPANIKLSGLSVGKADLCCLTFEDNSIESISCMHVIEHIGLGRYNDPMDPLGDVKAAQELSRVLALGGTLLIVVPVGEPKILFNAHRIYTHEHVLDLFSDLYLEEYSLIPDGEASDGLIHCPKPEFINKQTYGCGCYVFTKKL